MNLLTSLFSLVMRPRMKRFKTDLQNPLAAQERRLHEILAANANCVFGQEHGFGAINGFDDFRSAIPIRAYEDFIPWIERMKRGEPNQLVSQPVDMFATTSGTSSVPKFCPVTQRFTIEHHSQHLLWMFHLAQDHPRIMHGAFLSLISPAESGRTTGDIPYGSSSGRQYQNQALPIRRRHAVPYEVFQLNDYDARYHALLVFALGKEISIATSVNPSTLVLLANLMAEQAEPLLADLARGKLEHAPGLSPDTRRLLEAKLQPAPKRAAFLRETIKVNNKLLPRFAWPHLAVIVTWQGGSAPFYLAQLDELWGRVPRRCLGLRASEGTFSIPLADNTANGVLAAGGHVMEFLPEDCPVTPGVRTLLAHELERGRRYRIIITTSGGFYRYDLADIVEVTGFNNQTPEITFLHKTGNVLSITGEKVTEDQVVKVMRDIESTGAALRGFTVTLEMVQPPRYVLAVEPGDVSMEVLREMPAGFDRGLRAVNEEYATKRESGRLAMPRLLLLASGAYRDFRKHLAQAGRPDGQIKPPHLVKPPGPGPAPVKGCVFFDQVQVVGGM